MSDGPNENKELIITLRTWFPTVFPLKGLAVSAAAVKSPFCALSLCNEVSFDSEGHLPFLPDGRAEPLSQPLIES